VFTGHKENVLSICTLQKLVDVIELFRFRNAADIACVQQLKSVWRRDLRGREFARVVEAIPLMNPQLMNSALEARFPS
jgi:hypothetical protein